MEHFVESRTGQTALNAKEALEGALWMMGQAITTATVLSTANVLILGFAVENQQAGLLVIGALTSFILYVAFRVALRGTIPYLPVISEIDDGMILLTVMKVEQVKVAESMKEISDRQEKKMAIRRLERSLLWNSSLRFPPMLCLASVALQIALVPFLVVGFDWNLF